MAISTIGTNSLASSAKIGSLTTASGSAPSYSARSWVNFNGTGTVAIRASGNVSSITDNGTGDYTVNFTTAMSDANYAICVSGDYSNTRGDAANQHNAWSSGYAASTSTVNIQFVGGTVYYDAQTVSMSIFQ